MEKLLKTAAILLITLCLIFSSSATPARADTEGAATVTASALNMRSDASITSSIVTCLPRGTVVLVTGTLDDWYRVYYKGSYGYMNAEYLTLSGSADGDFGTGAISGTDVRVRTGPGTDYDILGEEDTGTSLSITGVSDDWVKVDYNGETGYVKSTYMELGSSGGTSSGGDSGPSKGEGGDSYVSSASGTGTINATYVRLRSGPGTGYDILDMFNPGTSMEVTGETGDWYRVTYDGAEGYVYKTYLTVGGSADSVSGAGVTAMSDTDATVISAVHMRTGPDTSYTSQRVLERGTGVTITGYTEKWYRVRYNGDEGYIFKTYLTTEPLSAASSSSEGERIVSVAKQYLGTPYVYGGTSPSGFDCSGFVYYVYQQCGYSITRTAVTQNGDGRQVSRSELQPGDIIIFYNSALSSIGHSGIYIGGGQFIHASSGGGRVMITDLSSGYYTQRFYSARRIIG